MLEELVDMSDNFANVLVMIEGKSGEIGFTTTFDGFESSMVFIDRIKLKAMQADAKFNKYNKGDGDSNGPA